MLILLLLGLRSKKISVLYIVCGSPSLLLLINSIYILLLLLMYTYIVIDVY